jgi:hypothetical protein
VATVELHSSTTSQLFSFPFRPPPLAGKPPVLAESLVHPRRTAPILALRARRSGPREATMANRQTSLKGLRSVLGAALLALGLVILFGNLDALEASVTRILGGPESSGMEALAAVVLATSHAVQAYAFDHQGFLPVLEQILVSFWPLILVVIGATLLRNVFGNRLSDYQAGVAPEQVEDR